MIAFLIDPQLESTIEEYICIQKYNPKDLFKETFLDTLVFI